MRVKLKHERRVADATNAIQVSSLRVPKTAHSVFAKLYSDVLAPNLSGVDI